MNIAGILSFYLQDFVYYSIFNLQSSIQMAGAGGLEPPNAGTKTLCLTAWLRPKILNGIISCVVPAFKPL
jgi:hypothetical protein